MQIKKLSILLSVLMSGQALASDWISASDFWVGAGLGAGQLEESAADYETKQRAFSGKLDAGYNINDHLGLYLGYDFMQYLPEDDDIHLGSVGVMGRYSLTENLNLVGKVGVSYPMGENSDSSGFSNSFGLGMEYQLTHAVSTRAGLDYYDNLSLRHDHSADLYQVYWGLTYRFGQPATPMTITKTVEVPVEVIKEVPVVKEVSNNVVIASETSEKLFSNNSSLLMSTKSLEGPLELLKKDSKRKVNIVGHTDNTGSAKYNQWLSERRAKSVADFFISQGIESSRITHSGRGENEPIANNNSELGRAQNRRVELTIK